ncbi:hypothetical protein O6H91_01G065400 [Diphasiastrum complanatum]|uniref:Uncharacterized protein n=1 Tax=Diphasiastrum complanatum TaxID=34168 RepID=A0ACC2ERU0_DIPCM|nr:hypothetical protein O6H91_01G065400 [Diphasiastrum complanatum]
MRCTPKRSRTQEPAKVLVIVQNKLPVTKKRSRAKRLPKLNIKSTVLQKDPRAIDCSHEGSHPGVTGASHPGKEVLDVESAVNWQDILQLPPQDGDLSNVENFELSFYDNTKWMLPESWAIEASHDQGETGVLLTETELIGSKEQNHEQSDLIPTWILEANADGKTSCSTDMGFACTMPNVLTISANQEDSSLPSCQKKEEHNIKYKEKEVHILIERERRKCMNELFATERSLLPEPSAKKDKATLLSDFIEHIRAHQQKVEGLKQKRANLIAVKSSSQNRDSSEKRAGTYTTSNSQVPSIIPAPLQAQVVPYVRIHRSGQHAHVTVTCTKNSNIPFSILKVMVEHHLQLVNVQISSNEATLFHILHSKVKKGSSFCKDDLHSKLMQQVLGV